MYERFMLGAKSLWDNCLGGFMPSMRSQELFERRKSDLISQSGVRTDGLSPSMDKSLTKTEV